jgi:hypothetical protein
MKKVTVSLIILGLLLIGASALKSKDAYARGKVKSTVVVYASGSADLYKEYPTMELSINNSTVCQWKNVKGVNLWTTDKYICEIYRYPVTKTDDVRVSLINASLDTNVQRTLYVDKIEIDGVVYETETPGNTFTATRPLQVWCSDSDFVTGYTMCNGYFKYNLNSSALPLDSSEE